MKSVIIIVVLASQFALVRPDFAKKVLKDHNEFRAKHSAPPLTLDDELSKGCEEYAKELSEKDKMEHSTNRTYGENLFWSTSKPGRCTHSWYEEIKDYDFKKGKFTKGTGHFTQLVWKKSKKLGVGKHSGSPKSTYVVCRYRPTGNIIGSFAENVLPLSSSSSPLVDLTVLIIHVVISYSH